MKIRSRKRVLYWSKYKNCVPDRLLKKRTTSSYFESWRAIESDLMPLFGNNFSAAWYWFNTPAIALNNDRPVDLVTAGQIETVRDYLTRLEYGVYT